MAHPYSNPNQVAHPHPNPNQVAHPHPKPNQVAHPHPNPNQVAPPALLELLAANVDANRPLPPPAHACSGTHAAPHAAAPMQLLPGSSACMHTAMPTGRYTYGYRPLLPEAVCLEVAQLQWGT